MSSFSKVLEHQTEFIRLAESATPGGAPVGAIGLTDINKVLVAHALCEQKGQKAFIITPDEASAVRFYEDLSQLQKGVLLYP